MLKITLGGAISIAFAGYGFGQIFIVCSAVVASLAFLSTLAYKVLVFIGEYLFDVTSHSASDWLQFCGYVLNFDFLYFFFVFYYIVIVSFLATYVSVLVVQFAVSIVPEAIQGIQWALNKLAGD